MSHKFHHRHFIINVTQHLDKGWEWFAYTSETKPVSITLNYSGPRMHTQEVCLANAKAIIDKAIK